MLRGKRASPSKGPHQASIGASVFSKYERKRPSRHSYMPIAILVLTGFILLAGRSSGQTPSIHPTGSYSYQCPLEHREYLDSHMDASDLEYKEASMTILRNMSAFLSDINNQVFDKHSRPYHVYKKDLFDWKSKYFKEIPSGGHIYESACGIGMNLYMTLDILGENGGPTGITVYGNDYVPSSVDVATGIGKHLPYGGKLGRFCASDSSNLSYVPSNLFDLVYTGYISPLQDPLNLTFGIEDEDEQDEILSSTYKKLCSSEKQEDKAQLELMNQRQEDWFAKWASEMTRIAKPGAPILYELIMDTACAAPADFGGVTPTFWKRAVSTYKLPVDPASIDIIKTKGGRYNVVTRKIR